MNVTEKDFDAFLQATESLIAMSDTRQFKSFKRRYLNAKEDKK